MFTRRLTIAVLTVALSAVAVPAPARADPTPAPTGGGGNCDNNPDPSCTTWGGGGGNGGGGGGNGGDSGCTWNGQSMPCQDPDFGAYVGNGCYWKALVPPPNVPPPSSHDPSKTGTWGVRSCYSAPSGGAVSQMLVWMDDPPGGPTPAQLAQQALAKVHLLGAQIGVAPSPNGSGLVGLPVWLWTAVTPGTWGPQTATATGGGITVTITAKASRIVWDMGDGHSVTCGNPGTAYAASYGSAASPTCGYRYASPSSSAAHPHGRYTISATTYWTVNWSGGGQSGVLTPTSRAQTSIEIGEVQVVTP